MRRHSIAVLVAAAGACAAGAAAAAEFALIGVIGDKAAVIAMDGGEPKTLKVGQTWNGLHLVSIEKDRAAVEVAGTKRVLVLGQHYRGAEVVADRQSAILTANPQGHFLVEGGINGRPVRFLVDTGATQVVLPGADARRLGIDYKKGEHGQSMTAGGVVDTYRIMLDTVRIGSIELRFVQGEVIEQGLQMPLLGMSFLNRVQMMRDGQTMTLIRRF